MTGTSFEDTGNIKCAFGDVEVPGKFLSTSEILCISPKASDSGYVDLRISLRDNEWSSSLKFLYYDLPVVLGIEPKCGPDFGYT